MINIETIGRYETAGGVKIYRLPVLAFPGHITNCYLVLDDAVTLIDTGSGNPDSNESLAKAFEDLRDDFGEKVTLADVGRVVITHGHVDHFGGLNYILGESSPKIAIHPLDSSTLLAWALDAGYACHALSFRYGQRHEAELRAAQEVAKALDAVEFKVLNIDLGQIGARR